MIGFEYYNPAKIVFGEGSEKSLAKLLKQNNVNSLLLVTSGDFVETLGIYDVIRDAVKELNIRFSESREVVPNPGIELVRKLVEGSVFIGLWELHMSVGRFDSSVCGNVS